MLMLARSSEDGTSEKINLGYGLYFVMMKCLITMHIPSPNNRLTKKKRLGFINLCLNTSAVWHGNTDIPLHTFRFHSTDLVEFCKVLFNGSHGNCKCIIVHLRIFYFADKRDPQGWGWLPSWCQWFSYGGIRWSQGRGRRKLGLNFHSNFNRNSAFLQRHWSRPRLWGHCKHKPGRLGAWCYRTVVLLVLFFYLVNTLQLDSGHHVKLVLQKPETKLISKKLKIQIWSWDVITWLTATWIYLLTSFPQSIFIFTFD